jgi:four helix bundle protein
MKIERFEDIVAWQKAEELTLLLYRALRDCRDFSFKDQIHRASISVMNNVAEGFEQKEDKEFKHSLFMAKGSCGEVRSMFYLAQKFHYMDVDVFQKCYDLSLLISKLLSRLIKTLHG